MPIISSDKNPKILIVDPDSNITSLLSERLDDDGYAVSVQLTAEQVLCMSLDDVRLIISEVALGGEIDGFELLERLRDTPSTSLIPFIFCTNDDSESTLIRGLNAGADDFIVKPFSLRMVSARIKALMRRYHGMASAEHRPALTIEYGDLILNIEKSSVTIGGTPVSLTPTEFQILTLLMRNRGNLFSRDEIQSTAWEGQSDVSPRAVDVNISRLRKKLLSYGSKIVNRTGFGYGFMD